tara:strand:+ start:4325 stop:5107 length:783 start_codon:yes stop_codon:yes gene_type:complete
MSITEERLNGLEVKKTSFSVDKRDATIPKPLPRTYNHFLLITAKPRQGKTTLMFSLLTFRKSPYYRKFDKVYVFSPSLATSKEDRLKSVPTEQKYSILNEENLQKVYDDIENSGERVLLLCDDVVNDITKNAGVLPLLNKMMMNRRHICGTDEDGEGCGLSMWMTTQIFNKLPRSLRSVADYHIIFKSTNKKELDTIYDEIILLPRPLFEEMNKYVFSDKHNFLLIDTNESYENMYHKNLNKRLVFNKEVIPEIVPNIER